MNADDVKIFVSNFRAPLKQFLKCASSKFWGASPDAHDVATLCRLPGIISALNNDSHFWPEQILWLRDQLAESVGMSLFTMLVGPADGCEFTVDRIHIEFAAATVLEVCQMCSYGCTSAEYLLLRNTRWRFPEERYKVVPPIAVRAQLAFSDTMIAKLLHNRKLAYWRRADDNWS